MKKAISTNLIYTLLACLIFQFSACGYGMINLFERSRYSKGSPFVVRIGGMNSDGGYSFSADSYGNIISIGDGSGDIDFNMDGDFLDTGEDSTGFGGLDIILVKHNSYGDLLWGKRIGGVDIDEGYNVITDSSDNIVISGKTEGDVDFNGDGDFLDDGEDSTGFGLGDIYIAKYDSSGNYIWSKRFGGTSHDSCYDMLIDSSNNIIIAGYTEGDADFNGDGDFLDSGEDSTGYGLSDIFVAKYNSSGACLWSRRIGGASAEWPEFVKRDSSNNILVAGQIEGDVDFNADGDFLDPGEDSTGYGSADAFVAKFDSSGSFLWARRLGGLNSDSGHGIGIDSANNVIVSGRVEGDVDFNADGDSLDGGEDGTGFAMGDFFFAKFNSSGTYLWSKRIGGIDHESRFLVKVDGSNNLVTCGYSDGDLDLNGDGDTLDDGEDSTGFGNDDIILSRFDSSGNWYWGQRIGGTSTDKVYEIDVNPYNRIIITGYIQGDADFNNDGDYLDPGEDAAGYGSHDMFIMKF